MILDHIDQADLYPALHPAFDRAFDFLRRPDLPSLADGRHAIDGDRLYALVARGPARGRAASPLEIHRRYLDIQYVVEGTDVMGWTPLCRAQVPGRGYDAAKDIEFFDGAATAWLTVPPRHFAIFFPADLHAPLAGEGLLHKVVVKVQVDRSA